MSAPAPWHLAQINIARLVAPRGVLRVAPFFAAVAAVNAQAETVSSVIRRLFDDADTPDRWCAGHA